MTGYVTTAEADGVIAALPSSDPGKSAWTALTDKDKQAYLDDALLAMEQQLYAGRKKDMSQPLQFPRAGQPDVPEEVKHAQALEACARCVDAGEHGKRAQMQAQGVKAFSVGSLSESYDGRLASGDAALYSPRAALLLRWYMAGSVTVV